MKVTKGTNNPVDWVTHRPPILPNGWAPRFYGFRWRQSGRNPAMVASLVFYIRPWYVVWTP